MTKIKNPIEPIKETLWGKYINYDVRYNTYVHIA